MNKFKNKKSSLELINKLLDSKKFDLYIYGKIKKNFTKNKF